MSMNLGFKLSMLYIFLRLASLGGGPTHMHVHAILTQKSTHADGINVTVWQCDNKPD